MLEKTNKKLRGENNVLEVKKKSSPNKYAWIPWAIGTTVSLLGQSNAIRNYRDDAETQERASRAARNLWQGRYDSLEFKNPYADMKNPYAGMQSQFEGLENTAEDLEVNLKQARFMKEQQQQNLANTMAGLQGAAGGSGIGGLAQALANAGVRNAQAAAGSIGEQESANERLRASEANRMQMLKAQERSRIEELMRSGEGKVDMMRLQGAQWIQEKEIERLETQYAMAMGDHAAALNAVNVYNQASMDMWGSAANAFGSMAAANM